MGLASVLYPSPTPQGREEWFFNHWQHHLAIIQGVATKLGVTLQNYPDLYPVSDINIEFWKEAHQQAHTDFESLLGIDGQDISEVDFNEKTSADGFYFLNWQSHQRAAELLGLTA